MFTQDPGNGTWRGSGPGGVGTDEEVLARCASPPKRPQVCNKPGMNQGNRNQGEGCSVRQCWSFSIKKHNPCLLLPTFFIRHRAAFRNVIAFPAAQGLAAIVPAGGRPSVVDITDPLLDPGVVMLLPAKVPAGGIGKEKAVSLPETPFTEVLHLMGFALTDNGR